MENKETKKNKKFIWIGSLCTAVFCILLLGGIYYNNNYSIKNTVGIDVNPSLELKVNKKNKVLKVITNNDEAKEIVQDMNLVDSDINVAVNAIIGSMLQLGYLDDVSNSILISVDGKNSETLRLELLNNLNIDGNLSVVSQNISNNYSDLAKQYNISEGKAQLISQIVESNPLHTFEELVDLSIHELRLLLGDTDNTVGSASEKGYIGRSNALMIALNHAGLSEEDITYYEIDIDYDDVIIYEVDFYYNQTEYEYEINAITGDIIGYEKEGNGNNNNNSSSSSNSSYIGKEAALEIALNHAGLSKDDIRSLEIEFDVDYNKTTYDIEFDYQYYEYEYEIDAYTGEILKNSIDR